MPCTNCMSAYTRTNKEHGCSKCGFGFCAKCLRKKALIPGLSPNKPLTVCDKCYDFLTTNAGLKSNGEKTRQPSVDQPENWWGDEVLPPPSLRKLYTSGIGASSSKQYPQKRDQKQWADLEERLNKLAEGFTEISTQKPNCDISSPDSGENAQSSNNTKITSTSKDSKKAKSSSKVSTISELEERLAALKGVPVDVVRNPGLLVWSDDRNDDVSSDVEAERLIEKIKASPDMAAAGPSNEYTNDAFIYDVPDACVDNPDFASTVKKTIKDAKEIEAMSMKLIKNLEQDNSRNKPVTDTACENTSDQPHQNDEPNGDSKKQQGTSSPNKRGLFKLNFFKSSRE